MASPASFFKRLLADSPGTSALVREGREAAFKGQGTNSLTAGIPLWLAKKVVGQRAAGRAGYGAAGRTARAAREAKFEGGVYQKYHRPLKNLDEKAGRFLASHGVGKNLFQHVDELPVSRSIDGHKALIKHETHSLTSPIAKAVTTATPFLAAAKIGDLLGKDHMKNSQQELMKEAADKLEAYEQRDLAIKLAFQLVEEKKAAPYSSFEEFEMKVAAIIEKGPQRVADALEMQPLEQELGELSSEKTAGVSGTSPETAFFHRLSE